MKTYRVAASIAVVLLLGFSSLADDRRGRNPLDRPIRLQVHAPLATDATDGFLQTSRWPLILRLEVEDAPALVEAAEGQDGRHEALVIEDPDGCIDMRDFPIRNPGPYEDCDGPDELFIEFTSERFDSHDIEEDRTGNPPIRQQLRDDPYVEGELLNKPYLRDASGEIAPLPRPQTGGGRLDGYGWGPDDDLIGAVIVADIGGSRIFDVDFDRVPGVLRNMAGFINTVSVERVYRRVPPRDKTALIASMHTLTGMFEPVVLVDLSVDDPEVDYLRRIDSGPVEALTFEHPPVDDDDLLAMLVAGFSPIEFDLRAMIVEGEAPTFLFDEDGDGKFDERDLELMGYRVLSNEVTLQIREEGDLVLTETFAGRTCPSRAMIYFDLDGNGDDGERDCSGTGGARRLRRTRR